VLLFVFGSTFFTSIGSFSKFARYSWHFGT